MQSSAATQLSAELVDACPICGWRGEFDRSKGLRRDGVGCRGCRATLRYRNQAASILTQLGKGRYATIRDLVRDTGISEHAFVMEAALRGPFIKFFSTLKNYYRTYLWADIAPGGYRDEVRCEDITSLTFEDGTFDLVVTSDVMEHVIDYEAAFRDIYRILKPGGAHVCSIPVDWPMPANTVRRAELRDGKIVHHHEQRFHVAGDGTPSLVCTDFGFDIIGTLQSIGFLAWFERPSLMQRPTYTDTILVMIKPW